MDIQAEKEKARAAYEAKVAELEREHEVRKLLPAGHEPRQVYTGSKLYGSVALVSYGSAFQTYSSHKDPSYRARPLTEAVALLQCIGDVVPFFTVKDGSVATKPEAAITERERERAEIRGPYAAKIYHQHGDPAKLEAFVRLSDGQQISVAIYLTDSHRYGSWRRVSGMENLDQTWQFEVVKAALGEAQFLRFATGASRGPRSGSTQVYLFESLDDLERLAVAAVAV